MVMKKIYLIIPILYFLSASCTDPYILKTNNYEEALVIEATLTNELKHQEIKLSKTYRLEQNGPTVVSNASVFVTDNQGGNFEFTEQNGAYVSVDEFQAIPDVQYQLNIVTEDGKIYTSSNETLTHITPMENIVASQKVKDGKRGVAITVNSFDPTNSSKYYRYEYEETYKLIAPKWVSEKAIVNIFPGPYEIGDVGGQIFVVPRTEEARTCYSTKKNDNIILNSTNDLSEDRVNYDVRFINDDDYMITNRYSILVKQYVQNLEAYTFYNTLKTLSSSQSILSQNQPGFFSGNIKSIQDPTEKVIGFFELSSVSSQRIFFNYGEIFPGEISYAYPYYCPEITEENKYNYEFNFCFDPAPSDCDGFSILNGISTNKLVYYSHVGITFRLYPIGCGDCTSFSSNITPSFWHD